MPPADQSGGVMRFAAYVGTYGVAPGTIGGGIHGLWIEDGGATLTPFTHAPQPVDAGHLVHAPATGTLYAVDERKTDGRGPVDKPAAVHALKVQPDGTLAWLNSAPTLGPRPTYLDISHQHGRLFTANHGDFQHVEKVVKQPGGGFAVEYVYDDSTLVAYPLNENGTVGAPDDVHVFTGHGLDPNSSPQNGGHAQSNPHAHCAVIDPSGQFVLVGDKGTDSIVVFRLGEPLRPVFTLHFAQETAPRHIAFDPASGLAYATLELSSELASLRFDPATGALERLDTVSTITSSYHRGNEPAEVRVHPAGGLVYVNNRGEDTLAWFHTDAEGRLTPAGRIALAPSIHPGLAARSFTFAPDGAFVLVADRPAHLVRAYAVDSGNGALTWIGQARVPDPAYIAIVAVGDAA